MTNPMISWEKASSSQCGMTHMSSTVASEKGHIFLLTLMGKSQRTLVMGSTSRDFTLKHHQWVTSFSFFVLQCFYHKSKTPSNNNSTHEGSPWEGVVPHLHMHTVCRKYDLATNMLGYHQVPRPVLKVQSSPWLPGCTTLSGQKMTFRLPPSRLIP